MFKSKDIKEIERIARAKERELIEAHYLEELNKLRKLKDRELTEQEHRLSQKHDMQIKQLMNKFGLKIKSLRDKISEQDSQIKASQKAWGKYKEHAYKLAQYSEAISHRAKMALESSAEVFRHFNTIADQLDIVNRYNDRHGDEIEGLLQIKD